MADLRAFRGTFYNPQVVDGLSGVIAPPYDVIDEKYRQVLQARSPFNIVRLILPQREKEEEFWNKSSTLFKAWKRGEVMLPDTGNCIYIYRQTFNMQETGSMSRTGIIAVVRCRDFSEGKILPHERTFPRTRTERLSLLRACRANFSQVFMVFRDPEEQVLPVLDQATSRQALLEFRDEEGVDHQIWRMESDSDIGDLAAIVGEKNLFIADGHHRYETALAYSAEDANAPDGHPRKYISVALFRSEDPGLAILPVHRLLRRLPLDPQEIYDRLNRYFHVEVVQRELASRRGMLREGLKGLRQPGFMMVTANGIAKLVMREGVRPGEILRGPESEKWKSLDVSILHSLVIGEALGLDANAQAEEGDLFFTPWESKALAMIEEGVAEAAFIMRATRIEDIWEVAEGGERMPHKSSYFHPKLPSGLVVYDHESAFTK